MRISGPAGDIAMKALDAKRLSQPIEITTEAKAWHLSVIAHPARSGVVQAIALRSRTGDAVPADRKQASGLRVRDRTACLDQTDRN